MSKPDPRGRAYDGPFDPRTARSETVQMLREAPRTSDELPRSHISKGMIDVVGVLKPPPTSHGTIQGTGQRKNIYYLWGDERRAICRFIEANEALVTHSMETDANYNHLQHGLDDGLYQLLIEEWQLRGASTDE